MNLTTSKPKLSTLTFKKLFNLGLHLNGKKKTTEKKNGHHVRHKLKWKISNPTHTAIELVLVGKMIGNLLKSGGSIAIINNGPEFRKGLAGVYASVFEGLNIICFEEEWLPGTFTNPIHGYSIPDLVIFLSVDDKDRIKVLSEITNLRIPILNLSSIKYNNALIEFETIQNATKVFFFMQFFIYWIQQYESQNAFFFSKDKKLTFLEKEELQSFFVKWISKEQLEKGSPRFFSKNKLLLRKTLPVLDKKVRIKLK